jgi:negative regulator of flagellin synthesis FlgM
MIDPIGVKPATVQGGRIESRETAKVVSIEAVRASQPAVVAETSARETARALSARPPVDMDRVQQIKRALAEGRYPLVPAKIADSMIAAQMRWAEKK